MSNRHERRKEWAQDRKRKPSILDEELVPVTLEQLQLAMKIGDAAATGKMPRTSFLANYQEAVAKGEIEPGKHLVLNDLPVNHAAMAILDTVPDKSPEGEKVRRSLLWRTIFLPNKVFEDTRAAVYFTERDGQHWIGWPLMEAMATTPMKMGEEPLTAIFARAEQLAKENAWDRDTEPTEAP